MAKRQVVIELVVAAGALAAFGVGIHFGAETHAVAYPPATAASVNQSNRLHRIIAYIATGAWVLLASYSVRQLANHLGRAIAVADTATAASVRLILTIIGALFVALMALAILRIGVSQLLLGGAITGVVLGIAAQQSLGNVFAGIVLLVARPFRAGDLVRVRAGSLGGSLEGQVVSMGLVYVVFTTEEGTTLVPNLTLLAAGIVRSPRPQPPPPAPVVVVAAPLEAVRSEGVVVTSALPDADQPPAGQPPAGPPSAGQPPAGEPSAGELSAGQPPADQPPAGQPPAGEPSAAQPSAGEPAAGQP